MARYVLAKKEMLEKLVGEEAEVGLLPDARTMEALYEGKPVNEVPTIKKLYNAIFERRPTYRDIQDATAFEIFRDEIFTPEKPGRAAVVVKPTLRMREDDQMLWMPINHSKATIGRKPENDECRRKQICAILENGYRVKVDKNAEIELIDEESGSVNYRVECVDREPVLFRVYKRLRSGPAIRALHEIQEKIHDSDAFSDSDFNKCLKPIRKDGGPSFRREEFKLGEQDEEKRHYIAVFPFADGVSHYSGEHPAQLESLAQKYGAVQRSLLDWEPDPKLLDLSPKRGPHKYLHWHETHETFGNLFDLICRINDVAWDHHMMRRDFTLAWHENARLLRHVWYDEKIKDMLAEQDERPENPALLHDLHPHNTFFKDNTCVLIYDYEAVVKHWSEAEALAFALHRFVREQVISLKGATVITKPVVEPLVDVFLKNYKRGGMEVPLEFRVVDDDEWKAFKEWLPYGIRLTNFPKLLLMMFHHHRLRGDTTERLESTWFSELEKFIMFIKEAQFFEPE